VLFTQRLVTNPWKKKKKKEKKKEEKRIHSMRKSLVFSAVSKPSDLIDIPLNQPFEHH
jgi:hypothetical protein